MALPAIGISRRDLVQTGDDIRAPEETSSQLIRCETLSIASRFESGRMERIDEPPYPPLAIREAIANALCHRDCATGGGSVGLAVCDDRLEVTSTGLRFGPAPAREKRLSSAHAKIGIGPQQHFSLFRSIDRLRRQVVETLSSMPCHHKTSTAILHANQTCSET